LPKLTGWSSRPFPINVQILKHLAVGSLQKDLGSSFSFYPFAKRRRPPTVRGHNY